MTGILDSTNTCKSQQQIEHQLCHCGHTHLTYLPKCASTDGHRAAPAMCMYGEAWRNVGLTHPEALLNAFYVVVCATLLASQQALLHHILRTIQEQDKVWLSARLRYTSCMTLLATSLLTKPQSSQPESHCCTKCASKHARPTVRRLIFLGKHATAYT